MVVYTVSIQPWPANGVTSTAKTVPGAGGGAMDSVMVLLNTLEKSELNQR